MHTAPQLSPQASVGVQPPTVDSATYTTAMSYPDCQSEGQTAPTKLSDEDREHAILRAGMAVVRHMGIWEREGCMAARGDADRARRLMQLLIAGRSPEQVARMQAAQNERLAREPGAPR